MPTQVCRKNCPEGEFLRGANIDKHWVTSSGYMNCVSPSGKFLGGAPSKEVLEKFRELPKSDQKPNLLLTSETGTFESVIASPPENGLILKVHARFLTDDGDGEPRYAKMDDFPLMRSDLFRLFLEPNTEYMWITEEEWKSLIPNDPHAGDEHEVDPAIAMRMARFHLNPRRAMTSESGIVPKGAVETAKLSLVVDDVSPERVRLRILGHMHWGSDYDAKKATSPNGPLKFGFEAPVQGVIEYDRQAKRITRFDMVLLGGVWGRWGDANGNSMFVERPGRTPFAFAFELADPDVPANRIPPGGNSERALRAGYFTTSK